MYQQIFIVWPVWPCGLVVWPCVVCVVCVCGLVCVWLCVCIVALYAICCFSAAPLEEEGFYHLGWGDFGIVPFGFCLHCTIKMALVLVLLCCCGEVVVRRRWSPVQ